MSRYNSRNYDENTCVFVGNLPTNIREREVEDLFYKFGRILDIQLKFPSRSPAIGFVTFSDPRDAKDAVRYRDGQKFDGMRLRVEIERKKGYMNDHARDGHRRNRYRSRDRSPHRYEYQNQSKYSIEKHKKKKKRDDSEGSSHDDTVGHYKGGPGDMLKSCE